MGKRKASKRPETLQQQARRLGITLPEGQHVESRATRQALRRGATNRRVGVAVATQGAVPVGDRRVTRFIIADGDGYAVKLHGKVVASGFATASAAHSYAEALGNRRFRRLAQRQLTEPKAQTTQDAIEALGFAEDVAADLALLVDSGAVRMGGK